jgi:hypothetical protein
MLCCVLKKLIEKLYGKKKRDQQTKFWNFDPNKQKHQIIMYIITYRNKFGHA